MPCTRRILIIGDISVPVFAFFREGNHITNGCAIKRHVHFLFLVESSISTFDFAITLMTRLSRGVTDPTGNIFCFLKFLLTRLSRGVTHGTPSTIFVSIFLLTRLSRGVTGTFSSSFANGRISTHTPLARRDINQILQFQINEISTHTPLARRDCRLKSVAII